MKITIISLNFFPEDTAIGLYSTQMAEFLSEKHQVEIITAFPYYPQWKIYAPYKNKRCLLKESKGEMTIYRSKQYVPSHPSFFKRILLMLTFTFGALLNIFRLKNKPDLVISAIPFTSSVLPALVSKWLYKSKIWVHIQDFEFDAAIESGLMGKSFFFKSVLLKIERFLINKSDCASTISHSMLKKLQSKSSADTYFLPNWIDDSFSGNPINGSHPYLDRSKFNVLYSGNIGEKQDWDFFLQVVELLSAYPDIIITVVGDGAKKKSLMNDCKDFTNVKFLSPVPFPELPSLLCSADVHILFQKNDVIDTVMPSKILGMLASEKVSVVTGNKDSEVCSIFNRHQVGVFSSSGAPGETASSILSIQENPADFDKFRKNAGIYVRENFSKLKVLTKFRDKIEEIVSQP